ncbi:copper-binding protein [Methylorubrum populi]|uniref:Copper-binding protein n=1 Tax=Methylorubrum rhodesianum TaxID=29427 RepID=A0ABU9Z4N7_9HYPH|nr:copper-binding protein [Methylorubrum rhodesianum]MBK3405232.1 copper-binding protein [Methylorubrum rhodesianum]MBY0138879.1 copper-binding protein [Methylorubrum populi]
MRRPFLFAALAAALSGPVPESAFAQPAKGAPAALERVREVMADRFRNLKLTGDPDRDFAELLIASYEQTLFLAKAQLDYGGDRQLRETAQKIQDEQQQKIDALKEWQIRSRQSDYRPQPNQTPSGEGPLDRQAQTVPQSQPQGSPSGAPSPAKPPAPAANTPLVAGTVQKLDEAAGKVTLDHERIPNIDMDAMTMAYRVADPSLLKGLKAGDKVRFSADRANGQISVTRIQKAR